MLSYKGATVPTKGFVQQIRPGAGVELVGTLQATNSTVARPAASITGLGRGLIAATYVDLGRSYSLTRNPVVRDFVNDVAVKLFPKPMVEVKGSADVDVCLMQKNGKLLVNLINTSGQHQTTPIQEIIEPVGPLSVTIRQSEKPRKITLEPEGGKIKFEYRKGEIKLTVPKVEIHNIVVVE